MGAYVVMFLMKFIKARPLSLYTCFTGIRMSGKIRKNTIRNDFLKKGKFDIIWLKCIAKRKCILPNFQLLKIFLLFTTTAATLTRYRVFYLFKLVTKRDD